MRFLKSLSIPITVIIMIRLGNNMKRVSRALQDETDIFIGSIQQTVSEIRFMKASRAESGEEKQGLTGIHKILRFGLKEAKIVSLISPIMYLVTAVIVGVIGYGGVRVVEGSMSTGSLVAFLLYLFQIIMPVTTFTMFF